VTAAEWLLRLCHVELGGIVMTGVNVGSSGYAQLAGFHPSAKAEATIGELRSAEPGPP
jgi:hypothetical protein